MSPIYDKMVNAPRAETATASVLVIDALQNFIEGHPGVQIVAIAATFLLLCERAGVTPQEVFTATTNLMNDHDRRSNEFRAVAAYIENEVKV